MRRLSGLFLAGVLVAAAADKKPPVAQAANEQVSLTATLYADKNAVKNEVGSDLGGYFILVKVEVTPKGAKPLALSRDDFLLRSYNDGQKCQPFAPSQIAGRAALVITSTGGGGGVMSEDRGPVWGGIGGPPRRMPGSTGGIGNAGGTSGAQASVDSGGKAKEDPLLAVLQDRILPEKEISEPVSGLLYFSLEGKHKPKDLALQYRGRAGKLSLQFR